AAALEAHLLRLVARRPECVTFDLSELLLFSSLAVGVLEGYRHAAVRAGTRVCLAPRLHPAVRGTLDRVGLSALFEAPRAGESCPEPVPGAGGAPKLYPNVHDVERIFQITWHQLVEME